MEQKTKKEVLGVFHTYIQACFEERDLEKTISLFHPNAVGVGSGRDGYAMDMAHMVDLYRRDFLQGPNPIKLTFKAVDVQVFTEDLATVTSCFTLSTEIDDQPVEMKDMRLSLLFKREKLNWLILHMHLSLAADTLDERGSFPREEAEERNRLLQEMVEEKTYELQQAMEELANLAITDRLTGIYNRLKFDQELQDILEYIQRYKITASIALIDVDYFKNVNDEHGHLVGDNVLRILAKVLQDQVRNVDVLARWGGEEFIILMPETDQLHAVYAAERVRERVAGVDFHIDRPLTLSIGVAEYTGSESADNWLRRVDDALYRAKMNGRNRVENAL